MSSKSDDPVAADVYDTIDHLADTAHAPDQALALAEQHLRTHPRDIGLLSWRAHLLARLDRNEEALQAYQRQQAILLAAEPAAPQRWQQCGYVLYRQARLARAMHLPEARHWIGEAVTRIGNFENHPARFEAGLWAWQDGEHDTAGRWWHDAMLRGAMPAGLPEQVLGHCESLGITHRHDWVWLARMRATLARADEIGPERVQRDIERWFAHVDHRPMAWRLRARARHLAGRWAEAAEDLERFHRESGVEPITLVWRCRLEHALGRPHGVEAIEWPRGAAFGGSDYHAASCDADALLGELVAEGLFPERAGWLRAKAVVAAAYRLGAQRFEHYVATGEGNIADAEPHVYAMLCNDLGLVVGDALEQYADAIDWHDRGWRVSTFWEQLHNRLRSEFMARRWADALATDQLLREHHPERPRPEVDERYRLAWAHDQLGHAAEALALWKAQAADDALSLDDLILEPAAETQRIGLMTLAAKAAAAVGERAVLRSLSAELLASDRLSQPLCERLAVAWRLAGDEAQAARVLAALQPRPPAVAGTVPPIGVEALLGLVGASMLDARHEVTLRPASPGGYHCTLHRDGWHLQDKTAVPALLRLHRGDFDDADWEIAVCRRGAGVVGRLLGRSHAQRLRISRRERPSGDWRVAFAASLGALWPTLYARHAEAEAAWRQLVAAASLAQIDALIGRLQQHGLAEGRPLDLGFCALCHEPSGDGERLVVIVDGTFDRDPSLPPSAREPAHWMYRRPDDDAARCPDYGLQPHGQPVIAIVPGDVERVLAAAALFQRVRRRFERWAGALQARRRHEQHRLDAGAAAT